MIPPRSILDNLPCLGWVEGPAPVTEVEKVADALGLGWLGVKRDDLLPALYGGTKVRKLDHLLAAPPWRDAPRWASVGALGSGHLVACAAAARRLERELDVHLFWQVPTPEVIDNLAFTVSRVRRLRWSRSRARLVLGRPRLALAMLRDTAAVLGGARFIAPGGSVPVGLVGVVRGAVELAEQIEAGDIPMPSRLYVALGSGGTAVGLAVGLGLAGIDLPVHAVAVVERPLASDRRVARMTRDLLRYLEGLGVAAGRPAPVIIERRHLGKGYGVPTVAARRAAAIMAEHAIPAEGTYTGKALGCLFAESDALAGQPVLFWNTVRGALPTPEAGWRERLPADLARSISTGRAVMGRRGMILGGASAVLVAGGILRFTGYPEFDGWRGRVFTSWDAFVILAAAEAVLERRLGDEQAHRLLHAIDRYVGTLPERAREEAEMLVPALEHTTFLALHVRRFSALTPEARLDALRRLRSLGGTPAQMSRGIRDLVMLGHYQDPATWEALGYEGPLVPRGPRNTTPRYAALQAPAGQRPRGLRL